MYTRFFGFKERPFKLVPNPAFVYLSQIHEEVLAHLNYAVMYGEGFIEITGEVGTGKTTLCRLFLESLDEDTVAAYIFNPKLDALQLLQAINDEFGVPSHGDSIKTLIDALNLFLLEQKALRKRVILVVDEAQNLSADVLEQLRLLSNLETTSSKLLQIILIGQPELAALLESEALRQLNQRINLSCELIPLSFKETREYIRHRIHIASSKPGPTFSSLAYRAIYRYAGGVPRRINIACDRALLTAFTQGKKEISYRIVRQALRELQSRRVRERPVTAGWGKRLVAVVAGAGILLAIAIGGHRMVDHFGGLSRFTGSAPRPDAGPSLPSAHSHAKEIEAAIAALPPAPRPMAVEPLAVDGGAIAALPDAFETPPPAPDLRAILAAATHRDSRIGAARAIVTAWGAREPIDIGTMGDGDDDAFFEAAARNNGLEALRVQTTLDRIQRLNMPSILAFPDPHGAGARFLALIRSATGEIHLSDGRKVYGIAPASLTGVWAGDALIFWKNYYHYQGVIPISSPGDSILSLKLHLRNLGFPIPEMTAAFDVTTRLAIETIQNHYGLDVDGMVGPLTKIALYNEDRSLNIPRLTAPPQRRR